MNKITKKQFREFKRRIKIVGLAAIVATMTPTTYHGLMYYKTNQEMESLYNPIKKAEYANHLIKKYNSLDVIDKVGTYGAYVAAKDYYSSEIMDD